jgi:hypothetical protein
VTTQMTSNIVPFDGARRLSGRATEKENRARATLEVLVGGTLADPEWDRVRARLLEFVSILRTWQREFTMSESELLKAA